MSIKAQTGNIEPHKLNQTQTTQVVRNLPMVGRYAPSPTGDLHLGNLRTALVAWLHTRLQGGQFLMRMEDIDTPRVVAGSDSKLLSDLAWLGLDWDDEVIYQSQRHQLYRDVLSHLSALGMTYPCFCSRKDIRQASSAPHSIPGVYPGTCAGLDPVQINELNALKSPAVRLRVSAQLQADCGDFVLHRADGLFAYQLAVVVDDLAQGVTDVVRGSDLSGSTPRQQYLAQLILDKIPLALNIAAVSLDELVAEKSRSNSQARSSFESKSSQLRYHHVPLLLDEDGNRMSKRDGSFSAQQWRQSGRSAPELVGKLAHSLGLISSECEISAQELLSHVKPDDLTKVFID